MFQDSLPELKLRIAKFMANISSFHPLFTEKLDSSFKALKEEYLQFFAYIFKQKFCLFQNAAISDLIIKPDLDSLRTRIFSFVTEFKALYEFYGSKNNLFSFFRNYFCFIPLSPFDFFNFLSFDFF